MTIEPTRIRASRSPTKVLTCLYFSTIAIVALLTICGQVMTQKTLTTKTKDAAVINVAGRQRMLSQKIAKAAHMTAQFSDSNAAANAELAEALDLFVRAHAGLQNGDPSMGLPGNNSAQIKRMFADIEADHAVITSVATALLDGPEQNNSAAIRILDSREDRFLVAMNAIVNQYEREATARVIRLKTIQQTLLGLTLITLLPVLVPIYQVTRKVNEMIATIHHSGAQAQLSSVQIAASGQQLEVMAAEQAAAATQVTVSSQAIATTANELSGKIAGAVNQAVQAQEIAIAGEQDLKALAQAMNQLDKMTVLVANQLDAIQNRAVTIDRVVLSMTRVADQSNLLSLNAEIEAEKAGKAGAGFSVVATEIRRLADQSAIATLEIEQLVKEMQSAVSTGVKEIDSFTQQVTTGARSTRTLIEQIATVTQKVQSLRSPLSQIHQGMRIQAASADQIRDAMAQLSGGTDQIVRSLQDNNIALEQLQLATERLQEGAAQ